MTKAGKDLTKREVILVDKSATEVCMTLWGNTAENFEGANNPILAAKNVRVSGTLSTLHQIVFLNHISLCL